MPKLIKMCALLLLTAGCTALQIELPPEVDPERVEISSRSSSGANGLTWVQHDWVLEKSGSCRGTVTVGSPFAEGQPGVTGYEAPANTYEQCLALLKATQFFQMSSQRSQFAFASSTVRITVRYHGQSHTVEVSAPGVEPIAFGEVKRFVHGLANHGKVVQPPDVAAK